MTAYHNVGWNDLRNREYVAAEEKFRAMFRDNKTVVSWWHKMAGWLGLGATLYAGDRLKIEEAISYCLMAEYVSAMLGLRVDVTSGVSTMLFGDEELLSPSAMVRKIAGVSKVAKERMEELRCIALRTRGLQAEVFAELYGGEMLGGSTDVLGSIGSIKDRP